MDSRQACSPLIQLFFGLASEWDIDQTNINRDIRDGNWLSNGHWPRFKITASTTLTSWSDTTILSIKHIVTLMITTSEQGPPGSQHDWIDWSVIERCTFERMSGRACGINLWIDLPWTIEQLYHCSIWITRICDEELGRITVSVVLVNWARMWHPQRH